MTLSLNEWVDRNGFNNLKLHIETHLIMAGGMKAGSIDDTARCIMTSVRQEVEDRGVKTTR